MKRELAAYGILLAWAGLALAAGLLPLEPNHIYLDRILSTPGAGAWLGYDDLGRRVADRLLLGLRASLAVVVIVVPVCAVFGAMIGMTAAWSGGTWDRLCMGFIDLTLAFPGLLLALALAAALGPSLSNVALALMLTGWVGYARLARAQTLALRDREHVQAARVVGTAPPVIWRRHVLPLIAMPLIIEATLGVGGVIVAEAGLSFLGLGARPPAPSLGGMIRDGTYYMLVAPHLLVAPGMTLLLIVAAVNEIGESLRRRLDVRAVIRQ
ncbi:MAG TPA: ABC transporter permease [Gammaproteobacteria bacterium]|nr:ABC transporter permease [Gammaproteobacteria bacterium]